MYLTTTAGQFLTRFGDSCQLCPVGYPCTINIRHPQSPGLSNCGLQTVDWFQMWPVWNAALFTCSFRALLVGGIESYARCLRAKRSRCASLTPVHELSLAKSELRVKIMVAPCTWNGLPQSSPLGDLSRDLKHSASFSRA